MDISEFLNKAENVFGGKWAGIFFLADCFLLVLLFVVLLAKRKKTDTPIERQVFDLPDRDKIFLKDKLRTTLREPEPERTYSKAENGLETVYARSLLKSLRAIPMSVGDKLETDSIATKIEKLSDKDELTADETRILNDGYSALLKMVAKYSL